jgi:RNA polymerase sigma-70 factor, ECF subfamily
LRVEPAEDQVLRFPGCGKAGESHEAEAREDARLLTLIAREDPHALAALYRRRAGLLYSLLYRMLVSEMEAQEALQDTFVQVWRRAAQFDAARSSPVAWLILIARGFAVDRLRARARRSASQKVFLEETASFEVEELHGGRQTERDELASACAAALQRLPEPQRRAIQLAFLRGWTHEEIASAEGEPLGTVKAWIRRGLLALRKTLKEFHG